jgi:hypothetical protein
MANTMRAMYIRCRSVKQARTNLPFSAAQNEFSNIDARKTDLKELNGSDKNKKN